MVMLKFDPRLRVRSPVASNEASLMPVDRITERVVS
jgi:hypothetical protein